MRHDKYHIKLDNAAEFSLFKDENDQRDYAFGATVDTYADDDSRCPTWSMNPDDMRELAAWLVQTADDIDCVVK